MATPERLGDVECIGIIGNPSAGASISEKHLQKRLESIRDELDNSPVTTDIIVRTTEGQGHATQLVEELIENGAKAIVLFTGDGTINEGLKGIRRMQKRNIDNPSSTTDIILAFLPGGTQNIACEEIFNKNIIKRRDGVQAAEQLREGTLVSIDTGVLTLGDPNKTTGIEENTEYVLCVFGGGFDGDTIDQGERFVHSKLMKALPSNIGRLAKKGNYWQHAIRSLQDRSRYTITVTVDGTTKTIPDVWQIALTNTKLYAGLFRLRPETSMRDGTFEGAALTSRGLQQSLQEFLALTSNRNDASSIYRLDGSSFTMKSSKPMHFQVDGQLIKDSYETFSLSVEQESLRIAVPKNSQMLKNSRVKPY